MLAQFDMKHIIVLYDINKRYYIQRILEKLWRYCTLFFHHSEGECLNDVVARMVRRGSKKSPCRTKRHIFESRLTPILFMNSHLPRTVWYRFIFMCGSFPLTSKSNWHPTHENPWKIQLMDMCKERLYYFVIFRKLADFLMKLL